MSETPKPQERDTFLQRAANIVREHPVETIVGVAITGGIGIAAGQIAQQESNREATVAYAEAKNDAEKQRVDSVEAAINKQYDAESIIGDTITLEQDSDLIGPAIVNIKSVLGEETYNDVEPLIYDSLELSAKLQGITQPGDQFEVIETDLNPEANDGNEYIIVEEKNVIHTNPSELPSPETH